MMILYYIVLYDYLIIIILCYYLRLRRFRFVLPDYEKSAPRVNCTGCATVRGR